MYKVTLLREQSTSGFAPWAHAGNVFASYSRFSFLISHTVIPAVATPKTAITAPQIPHSRLSFIESPGDHPAQPSNEYLQPCHVLHCVAENTRMPNVTQSVDLYSIVPSLQEICALMSWLQLEMCWASRKYYAL